MKYGMSPTGPSSRMNQGQIESLWMTPSQRCSRSHEVARNGRDNDLQGVEEDERQRAPGAKRGQPGFDACPIADQVNQRGTVEHAQGQQEERQKEQA